MKFIIIGITILRVYVLCAHEKERKKVNLFNYEEENQQIEECSLN